MSKLKTLLGLLFAACIIAGLALPWCEAAAKGNIGNQDKEAAVFG